MRYITVMISAALLLAICFGWRAPKGVTPEMIDLPAPEPEETLHVAEMRFTPEEAETLLDRFEEERQAAARREAEKRAEYINQGVYSPAYFQKAGRIPWGGWSWTWYSERILPGYGLRIPGRHTDSMGYVRDGAGFLCLASDVLRKGTVIETPFGGYGRVYDCGCGNSYTVDVYVGW